MRYNYIWGSSPECVDPSCVNGVEDGDEADVDCGGSCPECEYGSNCDVEVDCAFPYHCNDGKCSESTCGNGVIEGGEECDDGGTATGDGCNNACQYEDGCGNGRIDPGEECEGSDLGGQDCTSRGFLSGTLSCSSSCTFDTTGCSHYICGDGHREGSEQCDDGNNIDGDGCNAVCVAEYCGDGLLNDNEVCEGSDLGGQDCISQGFLSGTLTCIWCHFDTTGCANNICGNGTVETGEECDDGNTDDGDGCSSDCEVE